MAINKPIQTKTLRLKEEITSKDTRLMRIVNKNEVTGFFDATFPIQITAESITYELDESDNKIDIYDQKELGTIGLTEEEITALWTEPVVLSDGTNTILGNLLAYKIDSILAARYTI